MSMSFRHVLLKKWSLSLYASKILLISCLFISEVLASENSLHAVVDIENIQVNKAILLRYQAMLSNSLGQKVYVHQNKDLTIKAYDIVITDDLLKQENWYRSHYIFDYVPAINKLMLSKETKSPTLTAIVSRPFTPSNIKLVYKAENKDTALRLFKSGKVNAIVDYEKNNSLYRGLGNSVHYQKVSSRKTIFAKFKQASLASKFNTAAIDLDNEDKYASEEIATSHDEQSQIHWYFIGKKINNEQILVPYPDEIKVSKHLIGQLPQFDIVTDSTNISAIFNKMKYQDNVCVFNTFASNKRRELAHFSKPTNLYLDFRLFTLKGTEADKKLLSLKQNNEIDLTSIFSDANSSVLGIFNYDKPRFPKSWLTLFKQQPDKITSFNEENLTRSYELLARGRVGYIISYESVFGPHLPEQFTIEQFSSYTLSDKKRHAPAFLACSKSPLGKQVVDAVNALLDKTPVKNKLRSVYSDHMTDESKQLFEHLFK